MHMVVWMQAAPLAAAGVVLGAGVASLAAGFETVLEILGLIGVLQFGAQNLLFAKDRQKTADDVRYMVLLLSACAPVAVCCCNFGWGMDEILLLLELVVVCAKNGIACQNLGRRKTNQGQGEGREGGWEDEGGVTCMLH